MYTLYLLAIILELIVRNILLWYIIIELNFKYDFEMFTGQFISYKICSGVYCNLEPFRYYIICEWLINTITIIYIYIYIYIYILI